MERRCVLLLLRRPPGRIPQLLQAYYAPLAPSLDCRDGSVHDQCMAVKTITIDLEAYELLSRKKRGGQSFSQVIKEHFAGDKTGRDLRAVLQEVELSGTTLDAVEAQVKARAAQVAKAPEL